MPLTERIAGDEAVDRVRTAMGDKVSEIKDNYGQVDLVCAPENLAEVMTALRDTSGLECTFFTFLSGVDRTELEEDKTAYPRGLEVLVHVYSPAHGLHVNVHVPVGTDNPTCPTISGIYRGALWHERECHEFYGIEFEGHPRLVNLYLPEDFEGNPGLKAFKLPGRSTVKPWPGAKDPEEAAAGGR